LVTDAGIKIAEDRDPAKTSHYRWMNIEVNGTRVGKMRVKASEETLTIYSITIFPEFQLHGYASKVIRTLQESHKELIADRVRQTARGFWRKMGFEADGAGNFAWQKRPWTPSTRYRTSVQRSGGSGG